MKLHYTVINEQGQTFAVVLVAKAFLADRSRADEALRWLQTRRFQMPTTLVACDEHGMPNGYYGRVDLALILLHVSFETVPWQEVAIG
ncbi:MAG: hypothetical protein ACJ8CR_30440 [Roseiflexaceae bacterium]